MPMVLSAMGKAIDSRGIADEKPKQSRCAHDLAGGSGKSEPDEYNRCT
jgi:hypothetical protein